MSLRPPELAQVVQELSTALVGAVVQKVWTPTPQQLYLSLRQVGRTVLLFVTTEREVARLSVVEERSPAAGDDASAVQRFFRQELTGLHLRHIGQVAPRAVALSFAQEGRERYVVADMGQGARLRLERVLPRVEAHLSPSPKESRLLALSGPFPLAQAAEALFAGAERAKEEATARQALRAPLETRLKRLTRTLEKVRMEASRGDEAERHRVLGELLRHHLARLSHGLRAATLTEYTVEGPREVEVALDPALTPKEQVERHFHRYRRLLRGVDHARRRLEELERERRTLEAALARLDSLTLEELRTERAPGPRRTLPQAKETRRPYREYLSVQGAPIWVGRGGVDNDALTFRVARPEHWWLHARGVPGAHVVIPLTRAAELASDLLLDAAHLALHHSALKGEAQGEVSYTHVKFVRKVKGGAPGQVTYIREKTFWLRVESERLARLLGGPEEKDGG
jgi:predicted ribosome quality control (RQC) complex YloA/Tae2 family protein